MLVAPRERTSGVHGPAAIQCAETEQCCAVHTSELEWLPQGSEMPEETNCRFAAGQEGLLASPAGPVRLLLAISP